ncbi:MAG: phytanoyl-CoA dioxygenase family protein [Magnetospiraceae bacterium]
MKSILMTPVWLLQLVTLAKSFRANPIIGSPFLNRLGLHVVRVVLAHGLYRLRLALLAPLVPAADRKAFRAQGYLIKENFLPPEDFAKVEAEVRGFRGTVRELREGPTVTQRAFLDTETVAEMPACRGFLARADLRHLLRYTSSKNRLPLVYIENLKNFGRDATEADPQRHMHSDTFHPTMKAWLFIDDVSDRNGPFTFVPGSHRLTWKRLKWEYRKSLIARDLRDGHSEDGSFRFTDADMAQLGYPAPELLAVKPNTLVFANTFGLHRRGAAQEPSNRLTIWFLSRDNPFSPILSPWPRLGQRINEEIVKIYARNFDRRADNVMQGGIG